MVALGCLPAFKGESILLKIPHTLDIGLGGIEQDMTWKLPPSGLVPQVLGSAMYTAKGENIQKSYPDVMPVITTMTSTARYPVLVVTKSLVQHN